MNLKRIPQAALALCALALLSLGSCKKVEDPPGSFTEYQASDPTYSSQAQMIAFGFKTAANSALTADATGSLSGQSVTVTLPNGLDRTALVPEFVFHGQSASVGGVAQTSGSTAQDFSAAVTYQITAMDGTTADYSVSVSSGAPSSPSLSLASGAASTTTKAVTVTLSAQDDDGVSGYYLSESDATPDAAASGWVAVATAVSYSGTASFTLSDGDGTKTVYGWFKDPNNALSERVSDAITLSLPKALTAFSFTMANNSSLKSDISGTISGTSVTVNPVRAPHRQALIPTFTHTGASVKVGGTAQTSGTSSQDFTSAVTYVVYDSDGGTASYTVTVTVTPPIPDTGQSSCYNATASITCPTSVQTFYGQDAQYNTANQPNYTDNSDSTVTDNVTGLVWAQCSAGLSGANCATGTATIYTWANAGTYCTNNTAGLPGTGWRLPTKTELNWIVRNEGAAPTLDTTAFPATASNSYWTSASYTLDANSAWYVAFQHGGVIHNVKTSPYYVRCVR